MNQWNVESSQFDLLNGPLINLSTSLHCCCHYMRPGNSKPPGLPPPPSPVGLQYNKSGMWLFAYNPSMASVTHVLPRHTSPKRPGKVWSLCLHPCKSVTTLLPILHPHMPPFTWKHTLSPHAIPTTLSSWLFSWLTPTHPSSLLSHPLGSRP